ncbi:hypothetical protein KOI35_23005 [Actinoplanes bogorensis]|uniref:Uncharacterized protein n=1 Tax=Paractinoplanes bogorensis TaxID=1610840 RepID=A0ABS5YSF8_9ACTN|nr:hypothetical protein [Actinoplanes bogorensis]MBU2666377.1 hypothetical protein [Actinoplanes bogorensis]
MIEHLTFHESFDSTRATAESADTDPNLTQGQIEAVVSLLLGRSLSVNNTYAFDSRTFLELADVVLSTRAQVIEATEDKAAVEELTAARPFVLHRFRQPTFLVACADQLNRTREKFGSGLFRLSAWSEINEDAAARKELADLLLRIDGGAVAKMPGWLEKTHPALGPRVETLIRLNSFFKLPGSNRDARVPRIPEQGYIEHLLEVADGDQVRFHAIAADQQCPPQVADTVLRGVRERVVEAGPAGVRRAWVHDVVGATDQSDPQLFARQQLQEFQDTIYNAVMADSAFSQFDYMSSTPRTDARDELKHVNALAVGIIRDRLRRDQTVPQDAERAADRMSGLLSAASVLPHVPKHSLSALFRAYWELQAGERLPQWQASTRQLHEILGAPERSDRRLRTAWADHLRLLSETLPDAVEADDVELCVATDANDGVVHNLRLGSFDADELDRSISAGEHLAKDFLSDLARPAR